MALCLRLFSGSLAEESPNRERIMEDAKSFYFDRALSGSANGLDSLVKWASRERVLYGSDFLYATVEAEWSDRELEGDEMDEGMRRTVYRGNVLRLFLRFVGQ